MYIVHKWHIYTHHKPYSSPTYKPTWPSRGAPCGTAKAAKVRLTSWDCSQTGPVDQRSPWRQNAPHRVHPRISGTRISKSHRDIKEMNFSETCGKEKKPDWFIIMFAIARAFLWVYNPHEISGQPMANLGQRGNVERYCQTQATKTSPNLKHTTWKCERV